MSSFGLLTSAVASWTFCDMPLESWSIRVFACAPRPKRSSSESPSRRASALASPLRRPEIDDGVDGGHGAIEAALFGQEADLGAVAAPGLAPEDRDRSGIGTQDVECHAQRRRLARAIAAQEAEHLAGRTEKLRLSTAV